MDGPYFITPINFCLKKYIFFVQYKIYIDLNTKYCMEYEIFLILWSIKF